MLPSLLRPTLSVLFLCFLLLLGVHIHDIVLACMYEEAGWGTGCVALAAYHHLFGWIFGRGNTHATAEVRHASTKNLGVGHYGQGAMESWVSFGVFIDSAYSCNALQAWALATGRDLLANQRYTTQQGNLIRRYHYHIYATVSPLVVLVIL